MPTSAHHPALECGMPWQMLVIVAQLGVGGGLVLAGLRLALMHWLGRRDEAYSDYLAKRLGKRPSRGLRPVLLGILLMLAGVAMMATVDMTAEALRPPQPY